MQQTHLVKKEYLADSLDLFKTYAATGAFHIRLGDKTCFDHRTSTVILSSKEMEERSLGDMRKARFDVYHEIGHLKQLYSDPTGYRDLIESTRGENQQAKFEFWNCVLDVGVNSMIPNRLAEFAEPGSSSEHSTATKRYYTEELFKQKDLTELPRHQQFSYMLLLTGMDCENHYTVSPDVQEALSETVSVFGQKSTIKEFLYSCVREPIDPDTDYTVGNIRYLSEQHIMPIWEKLFEEDKKDSRVRQEGVINPSILGEGDIRGAIESALQYEADKNMSAEDRAKKGVSDEVKKSIEEGPLADEFAKRWADQLGTMGELINLWRKITHTTDHFEVTTESGMRQGQDIDIDRVINLDWPITDSDPAIMIQQTTEVVQDVRPKEINLYLNLDLSGSMSTSIEYVKDVFIALSGSVIGYNIGREEGDPVLRLSLVTYSNDAKFVQRLDDKLDLEKSFANFQALIPDGGTNSHLGLELIKADLIGKEDGDKICNICLEVTDGETIDPQGSRRLLGDLRRLGAKVCGIKFVGEVGVDVPDPDPDPEKRLENPDHHTFEGMYQNRGLKIRFKDLLPAMTTLLSDIL